MSSGLSDGGLHACQASRAADEKEVAITFGMLRGTGAGGRLVAWLERVITERNDAGSTPAMSGACCSRPSPTRARPIPAGRAAW